MSYRWRRELPKGGSRVGAGRKRGRKPGSGNRKKSAVIVAACHKSGKTPLWYMLKVMNDPEAEQVRRDQMAVAAAPYVHAKLQAIVAQTEVTTTYIARLPLPIENIEEWQKQTKLLLQSPNK